MPPPNPEEGSPETLRKRSMTVAGHRTSLSLEEAFWRALKQQAAAEGLSLAGLVAKIDRGRQSNLSSAVRVYLLEKARGGEAASQFAETGSAGASGSSSSKPAPGRAGSG